MCESSARRWFVVAALVFASVVPSAGSAQCVSLDPPCADDPPAVYVDPSGGSYANESLTITIDWQDEVGLNASSREIRLNGSIVTGSFSYSGSSVSARSEGTVSLVAGSNVFAAKICDTAGQCTEANTEYEHTPAPPPEEYSKPLVLLSPHHSAIRNVFSGSATMSFTTPAYVSLDEERAVTLVYSSGASLKSL
jgi:hypothetical protein